MSPGPDVSGQAVADCACPLNQCLYSALILQRYSCPCAPTLCLVLGAANLRPGV
jgi:hypothetical protein